MVSVRGCSAGTRRWSGSTPSFSIYDQADRLRVVKSVMEVLGWEEDGWTPERVEAAISRAKNELVSPAAMNHRARDHYGRRVAQVYELYEARLKMTSAVDFDDLLVHMVAILKEHRDVRVELDRRFKYVLVDEYQDTNLAQYAIVLAMSSRAPEPVRHRRPGPIDLWMARGQSIEHPRFRARIPGLPRGDARAELPQHQEHHQRRRPLDPVQSEPEAQIAHEPKTPSGDPVELTLYAARNRRGGVDRRAGS